jgi:hypothetical protein
MESHNSAMFQTTKQKKNQRLTSVSGSPSNKKHRCQVAIWLKSEAKVLDSKRKKLRSNDLRGVVWPPIFPTNGQLG